MDLLVLTSYLFLIPFFMALQQKKYLYSLPYLLVTITSILYHSTDKYCSYDVFAAYLVIFTNTIFIYNNYSKKTLLCILSIICALIGFYIYFQCDKNKKNIYYNLHTVWHIVVSLGTAILYI